MKDNQLPVKPEQIIDIIIKRHWLLIVPFCISMIAGIYFILTAQRIYQARTLIFIQPQSVPSEFVRTIVTKDVSTRVNTLKQRIMSRTNLEKIINDFKLYSGPGYENLFLESKIANLTKRISVHVTRGGKDSDSFAITYKGKDPVKVMKVTNALASFFINENLKVREEHVMGTRNFLQDELEEMRKKLVYHETRLKNYQEKYMGGLPGQLNTNLKILTNLNDRLISVNEEIRAVNTRISDIKRLEEYEISLLKENEAQNNMTGEVNGDEDLAKLKLQLKEARRRYTEKHPDVIRLKKMIENAEAENYNSGDSTTSETKKVKQTPLSIERQRQLSHAYQDLKNLQKEKKDLKNQINLKKKLVEATPHREQELLSIKRDYDNIKEKYNSLLERQLEAEIAVNMEKKQKGEQFRVIDPAVIPKKPVEPDMRKMVAIFLFAGLAVGGGIIFLLEFIDDSVKAPDELEKFLNIPVIATIPLIESEKRKKIKFIKTVTSFLGIILSLGLFVCFISIAIINMLK